MTKNKQEALSIICNIAYVEKIALIELANTIQYFLEFKISKINIEINYKNYRIEDSFPSPISIEKSKELLNYKSKFNISSGLKDLAS